MEHLLKNASSGLISATFGLAQKITWLVFKHWEIIGLFLKDFQNRLSSPSPLKPSNIFKLSFPVKYTDLNYWWWQYCDGTQKERNKENLWSCSREGSILPFKGIPGKAITRLLVLGAKNPLFSGASVLLLLWCNSPFKHDHWWQKGGLKWCSLHSCSTCHHFLGKIPVLERKHMICVWLGMWKKELFSGTPSHKEQNKWLAESSPKVLV